MGGQLQGPGGPATGAWGASYRGLGASYTGGKYIRGPWAASLAPAGEGCNEGPHNSDEIEHVCGDDQCAGCSAVLASNCINLTRIHTLKLHLVGLRQGCLV